MPYNINVSKQETTKYYTLTDPTGRERLDNQQMMGLEVPIAVCVRTRGSAGATFDEVVREVSPQRPNYTKDVIQRTMQQMIQKRYIMSNQQ
jgi:hypothetical protein